MPDIYDGLEEQIEFVKLAMRDLMRYLDTSPNDPGFQEMWGKLRKQKRLSKSVLKPYPKGSG